jgi:hypothetical protein
LVWMIFLLWDNIPSFLVIISLGEHLGCVAGCYS